MNPLFKELDFAIVVGGDYHLIPLESRVRVLGIAYSFCQHIAYKCVDDANHCQIIHQDDLAPAYINRSLRYAENVIMSLENEFNNI